MDRWRERDRDIQTDRDRDIERETERGEMLGDAENHRVV